MSYIMYLVAISLPPTDKELMVHSGFLTAYDSATINLMQDT